VNDEVDLESHGPAQLNRGSVWRCYGRRGAARFAERLFTVRLLLDAAPLSYPLDMPEAGEASVLAIDVGGTKTAVAALSSRDVRRCRSAATYASADFVNLEELIRAHLEAYPSADRRFAAIGIGAAGPVVGRRCQVTNLTWSIDADALERRLGSPVCLMNDLVALGSGLPFVRSDERTTIQATAADPNVDAALAPALLVAVGTGLGVSILGPREAGGRVAWPSEGGHVALAPRTRREARVLARLAPAGGRVEAEAVLAGRGWPALYRAVVAEAGDDVRPGIETAADVARAAADGEPQAQATIDLWAGWLGALVGDYALVTLPRGGVFLAGGVARAHRAAIASGAFLDGFRDKSPVGHALDGIGIELVSAPETPLWGAAAAAIARVAPGGRASDW
jgi:glucokinase